MYQGQKVVIVLPAYRAAATEADVRRIPSTWWTKWCWWTTAVGQHRGGGARQLGIRHIVEHAENRGYGGNQKSCYDKAKGLGPTSW